MATAEEEARRSLTPKSVNSTAFQPRPETGTSDKGSSDDKTRRPIPLTVPKPFNLTTDARIRERQQFDELRRQRQMEAEEHSKAVRERQEREEAEELKRYRKSLDFKATPINKYRNIVISPSNKELTIPEGPNLTVMNRRRDRTAVAGSEGSSGESSVSEGVSRAGDEHVLRVL